MAYQLESMLRIRKMREDRASEALIAASHAQELASERLLACERKRDGWERTKDARRDRVYAAIMGVPVKRADIDLAKESVSRIDEEGALLHDGVVRAQAELDSRRRESEKARERHVVAMRNREKIEQHRSLWEVEDQREREFAAEAELEEFAGRRMTDVESDDFD